MKVNGERILEGYSLVRQAERGIDAASESWADFVEYYRGGRLDRIHSYINWIESFTDLPKEYNIISPSGFQPLRFIVNRCRTSFWLNTQLLGNLGLFLYCFTSVLSSSDRPDLNTLRNLFADSSTVRYGIEKEYVGMRCIKKAFLVESYFSHTLIERYEIDDIISLWNRK